MRPRTPARLTLHSLVCSATACASSGAPGPAGDHPPPAPAGVVLDDRVETYPVRGRTVAEVWRSLSAAAPEATGTRYRGLHNATLYWQWRAASGGLALGCELRDVRVTVRSHITVPAWTPDSAAEPGLAARWAAYDAALRRHERGHEQLAADAAGTLLRALRRVRATNCADAQSQGGQVAQQILTTLAADQVRYDSTTGHGRAQGASWPPPAAP